jgi:PAS domain S-box-containing protein
VLYNASVYRDSSGQVAGVFAAARDISERKKAEERLLSSEKKFSTAFHANPAPMVITDPADGRIVDFNSACEAWSGYTRDEGIGQTTIGLGILSAEQRDKLYEAIGRHDKADFISMDYKTKTGEVRKILHSARFIDIDNKTHLLSHILDITEQSKAEKALIDRQARLNSIFLAAPTGIGVSVNRILTEVNDRICEMTGYTREELLGKSASMLYATKDEFDQVGLKKKRQMEQFGMGSAETSWRRKDGQIINVILTSAAIVPGDLTAGVTFTALDITRRKRAEEALRESEARHRFLTEKINDIVWVADMEFNLTYMSPSVEKIMGYLPQERLGKKASSTMTPESAAKSFEMFVAEIQRVQETLSKTTRPIRMELEYFHKNGSTVWMEVNASLLLDEEGKILGVHGVSRDITSRKQAETALRESEAKYRFLTEKMYDIIWTAGLDFRITYDSPSVERLLGYTPQERLGQKITDMLTQESYAHALEVLSAELKRDKEEGVDPDRMIKLELECYHKNGSMVWMECIVSAIRDHTGKICGYHGMSRDITDRKNVELELKKHREQLEWLINERTAELSKAYDFLKLENEARKSSENELRSREMELEKGRRELEEMNSALKVLLKQREEDKANMEMNIISNIKTSVLPYMEKLELSGLTDGQVAVSSMIKSLLGEITSPFIRKVSSEFLGFTPNEIQVAALVKEGKSSKEIAEILNISLNTVHTYRYKIRIKTGLKNNKVNLRSYLQTLG